MHCFQVSMRNCSTDSEILQGQDHQESGVLVSKRLLYLGSFHSTIGADRRFRSLLEVHRLMRVWGCVGCVWGRAAPRAHASRSEYGCQAAAICWVSGDITSPWIRSSICGPPSSGAHTTRLSTGHQRVSTSCLKRLKRMSDTDSDPRGRR